MIQRYSVRKPTKVGLAGIWVLVFTIALIYNPALAADSTASVPLKIDVWYGENQTFGQLGHPQRWVNILGNIAPTTSIRSVTYQLNDEEPMPFSVGGDKHRLARSGDFNIEIHRSRLKAGLNQVAIKAIELDGNTVTRAVGVNYINDGRTWPLPYRVDWSKVNKLQDAVQVVDGKWKLTPDGVRTLEPYYDRVLALGDNSWRDYEVTVQVTFHSFTPPVQGPPTYGVTHAAIALRWPGHDADNRQPHIKWFPLGATAEFQLTADLKGCRWRIFDGTGPFVEMGRRGTIRLGVPYMMKHRVETLPEGQTLYSAKLWSANRPEPERWQLQRLEYGDLPARSALLIAHNVDVTFGDLMLVPVKGDS
jgi:hypothetical protein